MTSAANRIGVAACALAAIVAAGCAARQQATATPASDAAAHPASPAAPAAGDGATPRASAPVRPPSETLERSNTRLAAALLRVQVAPSAAAHRDLAREYRLAGVLDKAHESFERAIRMQPDDAASHEALARIWRDWGTPQLGLGAAYRAVHFAPKSAGPANTLGTVLQSLGNLVEAERWYRRALALSPDAWYALNNICYVQIMRREPTAIDVCRRAVAAAGPDVPTAKNNLALAHAAGGDLPGARQWFRRANDPATAHYNYGITLMATRDYAQAAVAFADALDADPTSSLAAARAHQARAAAHTQDHAR
jgi:tetratricopeptide (TPR) repeat protein